MPTVKFCRPGPVVVMEALMLGLPVKLPGLAREVKLQKTGNGDEMAIGDWGDQFHLRPGEKVEMIKYFRGIAGYDLSDFISDTIDLPVEYLVELQWQIDREIAQQEGFAWPGVETTQHILADGSTHYTRDSSHVIVRRSDEH